MHPPEKRLRCSRLEATALVSLRGCRGTAFLVGVVEHQCADAGDVEESAAPEFSRDAQVDGLDEAGLPQAVGVCSRKREHRRDHPVVGKLGPGGHALHGGYGGGLRGGFRFAGEGNPDLLKHAFLHASGCFMESFVRKSGTKKELPTLLQ